MNGDVHMIRHADNIKVAVEDLVRPILAGERCLVVTAYQDFLTALYYILKYRPGIADEPPGTVRIVFGADTSSTDTFAEGRQLSAAAKSHWLGLRGLSLRSQGDLRAVLARDAVERGALELRVFDAEHAAGVTGCPAAGILHAKIFAGPAEIAAGSANFSRGGLRRNWEYCEAVGAGAEAYRIRLSTAEMFWRCGVPWKDEALEILDRLLRFVTPQEAACRAFYEMSGFRPWRVEGNTDTNGRPPLPFQAELVYEAAMTVYEHGFAFIEAPAGAGKTDIGRHLATILHRTHRNVVFEGNSPEERARQGAFAIVPPAVHGNWGGKDISNFHLVKISAFSQTRGAAVSQARRLFSNSAAAIVDECHRMNSRWSNPSTRSLTFDASPAVWSACLSATLLGNQGVDSLVAFHESRASLYMTDEFSKRMTAIFREELESAGRGYQENMFGDMDTPFQKAGADRGRPLSADAKDRLSSALAPFVCRRTRNCVGESEDRAGNTRYPLSGSPELFDNSGERGRRRIIERIAELADGIGGRRTIVKEEITRVGPDGFRVQDATRLTVRNFLNLLRSSIEFARWEWMEGDAGKSLREMESGVSSGPADREGLFDQADGPAPRTPNCDEMERLLRDPALDGIDAERAKRMEEIVRKHRQAVFLTERLAVLHMYAERLQRILGPEGEVFATSSNPQAVPTGFLMQVFGSGDCKLSHERSKHTAKAQGFMGLGGEDDKDKDFRAVYMTYQRAEGVNLQRAAAVGLVGLTSDLKCLIQGMGRIDRIDSPHRKVFYHTFDLDGLRLPSDRKAASRMDNTQALLGGVDRDAPEIPPGQLPEAVHRLIRMPRVPRRENFHDTLALLRTELTEEVRKRVRDSRPLGAWGAELCFLLGRNPFTLFALKGREGELGDHAFAPPRLIAVDAAGRVIRNQAECAGLLLDAYKDTKDSGAHDLATSGAEQTRAIDDIAVRLGGLRHWDIRPERTVALLSTLADFLRGEADGQGREMFGDFDLRSLEHLADRWAAELDPHWVELKRGLRAKITGKGPKGPPPDYLGVRDALVRLRETHKTDSADADRVRKRMEAAVERARAASGGEQPHLMDRVCVVFHCSLPPRRDR